MGLDRYKTVDVRRCASRSCSLRTGRPEHSNPAHGLARNGPNALVYPRSPLAEQVGEGVEGGLYVVGGDIEMGDEAGP